MLFDLYRTLIDIWTDEGNLEVWEKLARFLSYRDLRADPGELRNNYFALAEQSKIDSPERYPEIDVKVIFERLLDDLKCPDARALAADVARLFRTLSMVRFAVFPEVLPALRRLREHFEMGIVSDAQPLFLWPEVTLAGLVPLMSTIVISGDHGFHKPDPRLFAIALDNLRLSPTQAIYVGDRIDRDICGAKAASIGAVLLDRSGQLGDSGSDCRPDRTVRNLHELCDWLINQ